LVYTFRAYPHIEKLKEIFPDVFIFGNLKEDMKEFEQLLIKNQDGILGIANTKNQSRIEAVAVNKFNKGKLDKYGIDEIRLYIDPRLKRIKLAKRPTSTFCNWTMYKIQSFIDSQHLSNNFSFVHLNSRDFNELKLLT